MKYQVDSKSQNCIKDFNHRVIIIHLVSANFPKFRDTPEYWRKRN